MLAYSVVFSSLMAFPCLALKDQSQTTNLTKLVVAAGAAHPRAHLARRAPAPSPRRRAAAPRGAIARSAAPGGGPSAHRGAARSPDVFRRSAARACPVRADRTA